MEYAIPGPQERFGPLATAASSQLHCTKQVTGRQRGFAAIFCTFDQSSLKFWWKMTFEEQIPKDSAQTRNRTCETAADQGREGALSGSP